MNRRVTIRQDRTTRTWTVVRPRVGFTQDEVRAGLPSQAAAMNWVQGAAAASAGTSAIISEVAYQRHDGVSATPWWAPMRPEP